MVPFGCTTNDALSSKHPYYLLLILHLTKNVPSVKLYEYLFDGCGPGDAVTHLPFYTRASSQVQFALADDAENKGGSQMDSFTFSRQSETPRSEMH